jgi:8-amino-7-oxononanoate synthase
MSLTPESLDAAATEELEQLQSVGLRRRLREVSPLQGMAVACEGRTLSNFSSNDYLGLSSCEALQSAFAEAVGRYGVGSGASRLVSGSQAPHRELEETIALFKSAEAAVTFTSGFATALGVIPSVVGSGDIVILDKLCHASLIDAAKLSGATIRVFPHNHLEKLSRLLVSCREKASAKTRILVVTESIFSMDGDAAPLREMVALKEQHGAWLMVDEAHAVGIIGPQGRGLVAALGLENQVELQMGTLSKALGVQGGYLAASRSVIDLLINRARTLIYSTAPPAAMAATAAAAVRLVQGLDGETRREKLTVLKSRLLALLPELIDSPGAIFPVIIGREEDAMAMSQALLEKGCLVPAIRYPTVSRGQARLRLTLSAAHELGQIEALVASLQSLMPQLRIGA